MWAVWRQLMKRWSVEPKSARDTRLCCPGTKHWLNWAPGNSGSLREQSRGYLGPLPPMHTLARLGSWLQDLREAEGTFISEGHGGPGVPLLLTLRRRVCQHRPRLLGSVENNARSCGIWLPAANSKFQNPWLEKLRSPLLPQKHTAQPAHIPVDPETEQSKKQEPSATSQALTLVTPLFSTRSPF